MKTAIAYAFLNTTLNIHPPHLQCTCKTKPAHGRLQKSLNLNAGQKINLSPFCAY
jgi:hypothetical protein